MRHLLVGLAEHAPPVLDGQLPCVSQALLLLLLPLHPDLCLVELFLSLQLRRMREELEKN